MSKKLVILDFDHTLFNTTRFVHAVQKSFKKFGIDKKSFFQKRQLVKDVCHFIDIDNFINKLKPKDKLELHNALHDVIINRSAKFIFSDVRGFIKRHKDNFDIVVLTQGDKELQNEKFEHSKLTDVKLVVTKGSKDKAIKNLIKKYKEVYFIDDKAKHIDEVKQKYPSVKTYFIQRPQDKPYAKVASTCECTDKVIKSLRFTIK